jgi:hypothetical protein
MTGIVVALMLPPLESTRDDGTGDQVPSHQLDGLSAGPDSLAAERLSEQDVEQADVECAGSERDEADDGQRPPSPPSNPPTTISATRQWLGRPRRQLMP